MKKTLRISFKDQTYDVVVEVLAEENAPATAAPAQGLVAVGAAAAPAVTPIAPKRSAAYGPIGDILSPLAGRVVSIDTAVGASIRAGQTVVTLEAMKMNTMVAAPADGTVQSIHVKPGDAIEEGDLLVTLR
jgi:biotin carboxyl carrier protein